MIRFFDNFLKRKTDTIDCKTSVAIDAIEGKTCVYEIQLGRDEYNIECTLRTIGKFRKKDRELIDQIFRRQNLYGVLESERGTSFYSDVMKEIFLPKKKKRRVWCYCMNK